MHQVLTLTTLTEENVINLLKYQTLLATYIGLMKQWRRIPAEVSFCANLRSNSYEQQKVSELVRSTHGVEILVVGILFQP